MADTDTPSPTPADSSGAGAAPAVPAPLPASPVPEAAVPASPATPVQVAPAPASVPVAPAPAPAPVSAPAPAAAVPPPPPPPTEPPMPVPGKDMDGGDLEQEEKTFSAVGYFGILCLLPLLARKDSEYCQHHARQSLVFTIIFMVIDALAKIVFWHSGTYVFFVVLMLVQWVVCCLLALQGQWFKIPGIYNISIALLPPSWMQKK